MCLFAVELCVIRARWRLKGQDQGARGCFAPFAARTSRFPAAGRQGFAIDELGKSPRRHLDKTPQQSLPNILINCLSTSRLTFVTFLTQLKISYLKRGLFTFFSPTNQPTNPPFSRRATPFNP